MFFKRFLSKFVGHTRPQRVRKSRGRFGAERLEERFMMFGDAIGSDSVGCLEVDEVRDELQAYVSAPTVPELHSNPGAKHSLYLDFDGYEYMGLIGSYTRPFTDAFSLDDDFKSLSQQELEMIEDVWSWVAEDFAPFDVNVTTVDPGERAFENNSALRAAIGGSGSWFYKPVSGVSLGNPLGDDFSPNVVWIFSEVIQGRAADGSTDADGRDVSLLPYLANTVSHEAGHAYGLAHNSDYDSETGLRTAVYSGGEELRTPIMGSNRALDRATWDTNDWWMVQTDENGSWIEIEENVFLWEYWKTVDEMDEIAEQLGYRNDDHDASLADATDLVREFSGVSGAGIIEQVTDEDWFRFTTTGGNVQLSIDVLEDMTDQNSDGVDNDLDGAVDEGDEYLWGGANLDVRMEIKRINNEVTGDMTTVASVDPDNRLGAEFNGTLSSGDYVLIVKSHGHAGDAGQYTISGHVPKFSIESPYVPEILPTNPFAFLSIDPTFDTKLTESQKEEIVTVKSTLETATVDTKSVAAFDAKTTTDLKAAETTSLKDTEVASKSLTEPLQP